jgi:DNA-binding GntR family transcriptional regulator
MRSHRADDEHRAILAACRTRDAERAAAAARDHLERTMNSVLEFLRSEDGPSGALLE